MAYSTDAIYRIWDDDQGACIEVGPDADGIALEIRNGADETSRRWYGEFRLPIGSIELAQSVAAAILKAAEAHFKRDG